jgi:hypothetical protein
MTDSQPGAGELDMSNVLRIVEMIETGDRVTVADLAGLTLAEMEHVQECLPDARIVFDPIK